VFAGVSGCSARAGVGVQNIVERAVVIECDAEVVCASRSRCIGDNRVNRTRRNSGRGNSCGGANDDFNIISCIWWGDEVDVLADCARLQRHIVN
jgi:hypothetical protein